MDVLSGSKTQGWWLELDRSQKEGPSHGASFGWRARLLEVCLQNPDPGPGGLERGKGRGTFTDACGVGVRAVVTNTTDGASLISWRLEAPEVLVGLVPPEASLLGM